MGNIYVYGPTLDPLKCKNLALITRIKLLFIYMTMYIFSESVYTLTMSELSRLSWFNCSQQSYHLSVLEQFT